ncbi:hypothetical protein JCM17846_04680 [Iodidimonas nitroreducens]|uniref:Uncharacterized protein n=1 Tax=Iodidimonas nitroreducens TaxID=1236968 RepID=A0A5A7N6Y0_9PROT|nr:hypothetical protein JCM17846_04680 [Iodidimonas nitroreducens]
MTIKQKGQTEREHADEKPAKTDCPADIELFQLAKCLAEDQAVKHHFNLGLYLGPQAPKAPAAFILQYD